MSETAKGERIPTSREVSYSSSALMAYRKKDQPKGELTTFGRTSKAYRQYVADSLKAINETAEVVYVDGTGVYRNYDLVFTVTHKIIPL